MAVVRKVQSKVIAEEKKGPQAEVREAGGVRRERDKSQTFSRTTKKYCHFCKTKTLPRYWDAAALRRCLNDRGRIVPRVRSGCCAKHQRRVSQEIKRSRHLALLPFTVRV